MTVIEMLRTARDDIARAEAIASRMSSPSLVAALKLASQSVERAISSQADLLSVRGGRGA